MPQIPDFDDTRACPACGHVTISMKYDEKRQILNLDQRTFNSIGLIQKTCDRCSFRWLEIPLHLVQT